MKTNVFLALGASDLLVGSLASMRGKIALSVAQVAFYGWDADQVKATTEGGFAVDLRAALYAVGFNANNVRGHINPVISTGKKFAERFAYLLNNRDTFATEGDLIVAIFADCKKAGCMTGESFFRLVKTGCAEKEVPAILSPIAASDAAGVAAIAALKVAEEATIRAEAVKGFIKPMGFDFEALPGRVQPKDVEPVDMFVGMSRESLMALILGAQNAIGTLDMKEYQEGQIAMNLAYIAQQAAEVKAAQNEVAAEVKAAQNEVAAEVKAKVAKVKAQRKVA